MKKYKDLKKEDVTFTHDCGYCYLIESGVTVHHEARGRFEAFSKVYDFYICKSKFEIAGFTIIARYGNGGADYSSGATFIGLNEQISKGFDIALEKGIFEELGIDVTDILEGERYKNYKSGNIDKNFN
jgi:hypothetical protein